MRQHNGRRRAVQYCSVALAVHDAPKRLDSTIGTSPVNMIQRGQWVDVCTRQKALTEVRVKAAEGLRHYAVLRKEDTT